VRYSAENHNLVIRNAQPEELEEISVLLRESYQQYQIFIPPERWKPYLEDIMDVRSRMDDSELIVAEVDQRLVGCVTLFLDGAKSFPEAWPSGWAVARLLAVHPDFRGRRIGHALMEECMRRCRRAGIKTVGLHTTEIMEVARGMYERMGFVRVPEHDFSPAPGITVMAYRLHL